MSGLDDKLGLPTTARVTSDMAAAAARYLRRKGLDDLLPMLGLVATRTHTENGLTYCDNCGHRVRNERGICGEPGCQEVP